MLTQDTLRSPVWARKPSKRLGRGNGSWKGTFCWRGCKGQNARAWGWVPDWFEGGQTPLFRRMPKLKGFSNAVFTKHYNVINISDISKLAEVGITTIDKQVLLDAKIIRRKKLPVKLLWSWELSTSVTIHIDLASQSAIKSIKDSGWTLTLISSN